MKLELGTEQEPQHLNIEQVTLHGAVPRDRISEVHVLLIALGIDALFVKEVRQVLLEESNKLMHEGRGARGIVLDRRRGHYGSRNGGEAASSHEEERGV